MLLQVDEQQLAHVIAALRLLQCHANDGYAEEHNFADILDGFTRLTEVEVGSLCEDLNFGKLCIEHPVVVVHFAGVDGPFDNVFEAESWSALMLGARIEDLTPFGG